jgi:hypothetical protein
MLGLGEFPIKMHCSILVSKSFLKRYRWGKCGWVDKICMNCYSPISLLLCQGTDYAKDGGNYVPHNKLKNMNESKKGEHD